MSAWKSFKEFFYPSAPEPLGKGMFHYMTPEGAEDKFRIHLRVEDDGDGILVINAAKVLHLNQTATEHAKLMLEEKDTDTAVKEIRKRYKVSAERAREDHEHLRDTILTLATTDDICPISYLDVKRIEPFDTPVSAPYRMDLALTYRCNADCGHCYVGRPRDMESLSTEEWKRVIGKLWDLGIPHVVFTGGEATLYPDLAELIQEGDTLVAHNVHFDLVQVLARTVTRLGITSDASEKVLATPRFCTMRCAYSASVFPKWPSLADLCQHFGVALEGAHDARADSAALAACVAAAHATGVMLM